ncbi:MAG: ABC transporter permease [Gammaproteobacteria bacterium]|nr:ABC transporter permease [Gammaproteobacteria bacterium]
MFKFARFIAVLNARNREFWRDRAAMSWNLIFPLLLILGLSLVFSDENPAQYKVAIVGATEIPEPLEKIKYIDYVLYDEQSNALQKLQYHQIDFLINWSASSYALNNNSPKGYLAAKIFESSLHGFTPIEVSGRAIRYVDWVIPGVLGMNTMFSCLFGVGYVIVRYRKSGVLKRLNATPLTAFEFVLAQVASRFFIVVSISVLVFLLTWWAIDFLVLGSLGLLLLILLLGTLSLISLGLMVASKSSSEELTGGLLNVASWPMIILSGVWFSLEGAPQWLQYIAQIFPLTHMVSAARDVMIDGATFRDIAYHIIALAVMSGLFLIISALAFSWGKQR